MFKFKRETKKNDLEKVMYDNTRTTLTHYFVYLYAWMGSREDSLDVNIFVSSAAFVIVKIVLLLILSGKLACGRQAFIATWLFDPSMSALPIIVKQNSQSVGLFTLSRERELGLDRRETG